MLGRAQHVHARIGAPRPLASTPSAIDDARVAHAVARQGKGCSLPAQSTADDEHVEHRLPSGPAVAGTQLAAGKFMRAKSCRAWAASSSCPEGIMRQKLYQSRGAPGYYNDRSCHKLLGWTGA